MKTIYSDIIDVIGGDIKLKDIKMDKGDVMDLVYDFGDNWLFAVTFEDVVDEYEGETGVILLHKKGSAPRQY